MDYKTNILTTTVTLEDELFPDIFGLRFGQMDSDRIVFDCTEYLESNDLKNIDYKSFMRLYRHQIEHIATSEGIDISKLFYQNTDGHILIRYELVIIFLMFANDDIFDYFSHIIMKALTEGVAFSGRYAYRLASEELPTDILKSIIQEREQDETGNEQRSDADTGV